MSSKRKFSEFNTDPSDAGETRAHAPSRQNSKYKKSGPTKEKSASTGWLKKRARTIERRLNHKSSLPANVKHDLEKELDHHKQKLDDLADGRKRKNMIKKYHMVRFFERKKADRLAKQIRTQLEATTDKDEREKLQADLHIAEVDALYAKYFPHRERYISLYPVTSLGLGVQGGVKAEDASTAARALHAERPPLWGVIEKAANKGNSALVQIQERKSPVDAESKQARERPSKEASAAKASQPKAKSKHSGAAEPHEGKGRHGKSRQSSDSSGDDSDGGFFEEG
ncbi:hypothetical protein F5Y14DRAFT_212437 [Nemania sp. NC0429]|nr:hypothetical protein F5Y14DRAFT_212437 [Nemania sp. NC0429]